MRAHRIGAMTVSVVGLGCNNFGFRIDEAGAAETVRAARSAGIDFFDTADVYGSEYGESERLLGRALGSAIRDVHVATKFGSPSNGVAGGGRPAYIRSALDGSLRRLGTDCIDLYQMHGFDPETPLDETFGCLRELVSEGKVREIGCSNFTGTQLRESARVLGRNVAALQNRYNMFERTDAADGLAACADLGVAYLPYFPPASGVLTGKYRFGSVPAPGSRGGTLNERNAALVEQLDAWAGPRGRTVAEVAIVWLLAHAAIPSVIAGATSPEQVVMNAAAGDWELSTDEVDDIQAIIDGVDGY